MTFLGRLVVEFSGFEPLFSVFFFNAVYIIIVLKTQELCWELPVRGSTIPRTNQKFLYAQDYWTMTYGDFIGVPLILNAFVRLVMEGVLGIDLWLVFAFIALSSMAIFYRMCTSKDHKPDYGFPRVGKISIPGILHLPYFGVGIGASSVAIFCLLTGQLHGPVMWFALLGGAIYLVCFALEIKSGNFDPLKPIEEKV